MLRLCNARNYAKQLFSLTLALISVTSLPALASYSWSRRVPSDLSDKNKFSNLANQPDPHSLRPTPDRLTRARIKEAYGKLPLSFEANHGQADFGGSGDENVRRVTLDSPGNACLIGDTLSTDFPTANPLQPANGGGRDAFTAKIAEATQRLLTLTFDELPTQPVDGLTFMGVTFDFRIDELPSANAHYNASGPGILTFVQDPSLEGDAAGILTLNFAAPTSVLSFGLSRSTFESLTPGFTVQLFDPAFQSLGVFPVDTIPLISFSENRFNYSGEPVSRAVITFDNPVAAPRFALDNLTFEPRPGAPGEPSLTEILMSLGFTNIVERPRRQTFPAGTYELQLLAEFSAYHEGNTVSQYPVGTSQLQVLFTGPEGNFGFTNPPISTQFTAFARFGLAIDTPVGQRFFTRDRRNSDGARRARIFRDRTEPGSFLIGFEDDSGDQDFQDVVLRLRRLAP